MLDVSKTFYWSDTPVLGMAGPCRGAFKGFAPCRRPPTAKSKQLKANSRFVNLLIADRRIVGRFCIKNLSGRLKS